MILIIKKFLLRKLPDALKQIQIGRVPREKMELDLLQRDLLERYVKGGVIPEQMKLIEGEAGVHRLQIGLHQGGIDRPLGIDHVHLQTIHNPAAQHIEPLIATIAEQSAVFPPANQTPGWATVVLPARLVEEADGLAGGQLGPQRSVVLDPSGLFLGIRFARPTFRFFET